MSISALPLSSPRANPMGVAADIHILNHSFPKWRHWAFKQVRHRSILVRGRPDNPGQPTTISLQTPQCANFSTTLGEAVRSKHATIT
jgi:hypothetical protein